MFTLIFIVILDVDPSTELKVYAAINSLLLQDDRDLKTEFYFVKQFKSYDNSVLHVLAEMMRNRYLFLRVSVPEFNLINNNIPQYYFISFITLDHTYYNEINVLDDISQRKNAYEKLYEVAERYFSTDYMPDLQRFVNQDIV